MMEKEDAERLREEQEADDIRRKKFAEMSERKDYSDLEVVVGPVVWADEKIPVHPEKQLPPVPWDATGDGKMSMDELRPYRTAILSPTATDPVPAYYPDTTRDFHSRESETDDSMYNAKLQENLARERREETKVCGMTNKVAMCVALGLIVFILALLATVIGVYVTIRSGASHKSSTSSSGTMKMGTAILNNSDLAAVNWTDTAGVSRTAVFYQDESNTLMVSLFDTLSNSWTISNVTDRVLNTTRAATLDVMPGTPLAAVTNSYQVSLYYLTSSNMVSEIWTSDIVGEVWYAGVLGKDLAPMAQTNSRLAAFWQICANCTNSLFLVYQNEDSALKLCNLTNGVWQDSGIISTQSVEATGLAMSAFTENNGTGNFTTNDNALRVWHFDAAGQLLELDYGPSTNYTWEAGNFGSALSAGVDTTASSPEVASMTFGDHGWTNGLVTYLTDTGTLVSHYSIGGGNWTAGAPSLKSGPAASTNIMSLAMSQVSRIYGLSDGGIYEWKVEDASDPLIWEYVSTAVAAS